MIERKSFMSVVCVFLDNILDQSNVEVLQDYARYFSDIRTIEPTNNGLMDAFQEIDADYIILTTSQYYADDCYMMLNYMESHNCSMLVGNRMRSSDKLSKIASKKYKKYIPDILSPCRVLKKSFYKNVKLKDNLCTDLIKYCDNFAFIDLDIDKREQISFIQQLKIIHSM